MLSFDQNKYSAKFRSKTSIAKQQDNLKNKADGLFKRVKKIK